MATTLAVFDFDGTLFTKNSPLDFARFAHPGLAFWTRFLGFVPFYALFKLGAVDHVAAKARFLRVFFAGRSIEELERQARAYAEERIAHHLDPFHMERLAYHRASGHRVVVVSATFRFIIEPWCRTMGLDLVATEVETRNGKVTSRLPAGNCYGEAKIQALERTHPLAGNYVYAYGDSHSDVPLLQRADCAYYAGAPVTDWAALRQGAPGR